MNAWLTIDSFPCDLIHLLHYLWWKWWKFSPSGNWGTDQRNSLHFSIASIIPWHAFGETNIWFVFLTSGLWLVMSPVHMISRDDTTGACWRMCLRRCWLVAWVDKRGLIERVTWSLFPSSSTPPEPLVIPTRMVLCVCWATDNDLEERERENTSQMKTAVAECGVVCSPQLNNQTFASELCCHGDK